MKFEPFKARADWFEQAEKLGDCEHDAQGPAVLGRSAGAAFLRRPRRAGSHDAVRQSDLRDYVAGANCCRLCLQRQ